MHSLTLIARLTWVILTPVNAGQQVYTQFNPNSTDNVVVRDRVILTPVNAGQQVYTVDPNIMANMMVGDRVILTPVNGGQQVYVRSLTLISWPTWWGETGSSSHPSKQSKSASIRTQFNPNVMANMVVAADRVILTPIKAGQQVYTV
jgi:hypothetical protein